MNLRNCTVSYTRKNFLSLIKTYLEQINRYIRNRLYLNYLKVILQKYIKGIYYIKLIVTILKKRKIVCIGLQKRTGNTGIFRKQKHSLSLSDIIQLYCTHV